MLPSLHCLAPPLRMASTLQHLSAIKAVNDLTRSGTAVEASALFRNMEPIQQELVFKQLFVQHQNLRAENAKNKAMLNTLEQAPDADLHALRQSSKRLERPDAGEDDQFSFDEFEPYNKARHFQAVWRYALPEDRQYLRDPNEIMSLAFRQDEDVVYWDPMRLIKEPGDDRIRHATFEEEQNRIKRTLTETGEFKRGRQLYECISSQLLLYRLTATLGPPPSEMMQEMYLDGYKSCWGAMIVLRAETGTRRADAAQSDPLQQQTMHPGSITSWLELYDYKGGASVEFMGREDVCDRALELLNYLIGESCAHSYDRVLAGRVA